MKNFFKILCVAVLTITFAFTNVDKKTVVIDVGHGGQDTGLTVEDHSEKEVTLSIAKKIKALNTNSNIEIILTRETDEFLPILERAKQINALQPDLVISLHTNYGKSKDRSGKEIYISDNSIQKEKCNDLALQLANSFDDSSIPIKKANFYLLKNVEYPIALFELGFLTNDKDRQELTSEKGQTDIAASIFRAIN
ncbi:MAG: N-acetylmuramoyl-L-alanine amidase family protein [bacterium]